MLPLGALGLDLHTHAGNYGLPVRVNHPITEREVEDLQYTLAANISYQAYCFYTTEVRMKLFECRDSKWYIGADFNITNSAVRVRDSKESWNSREEALGALLTRDWTQRVNE